MLAALTNRIKVQPLKMSRQNLQRRRSRLAQARRLADPPSSLKKEKMRKKLKQDRRESAHQPRGAVSVVQVLSRLLSATSTPVVRFLMTGLVLRST